MTKKHGLTLIFSLALALAGVLAWSAGPVWAQSSQPTPSDDDVNRVAQQLYCPVCENIPLDVCPTQACQEWRELIRLKLSEGWTDQQIREYFAVQYGDRVLSEPPRRGLNWLVYLMPPVFILFGAVILWRVLSSMNKKRAESVAAVDPETLSPADDPYLARIEEELKKKD